jgi:hypothetical protein
MTRSNLMDLSEVGPVKVEGKRLNTEFVDNQTTKVMDANYFPSYKNDPNSGAIEERWAKFPCLLVHAGQKDPNLGKQIEDDLPHIIKYLAFEDWNNGVFPTDGEMSWSNHTAAQRLAST